MILHISGTYFHYLTRLNSADIQTDGCDSIRLDHQKNK